MPEYTEPQLDPVTGETTSAAYSTSVALSVAVIDNTAQATVHGGAQLDALRALRVISDVSYPFLQRLDEFIPLSWGEPTDAVRRVARR